MSDKRSYDRVRFTLQEHMIQSRDYRTLFRDVFGSCLSEHTRSHFPGTCGPLTFECRPSQFARFLILRNTRGMANDFKGLNAVLIAPREAVQVADLSHLSARYYDTTDGKGH